MATRFSCLSYTLCYFFLLFLTLVSSFSPIDHYLINCGSHEPTTLDTNNRRFTGDYSDEGPKVLYSSQTISVSDEDPVHATSPIYHTARVFTRPSQYAFAIKDPGTHLVRLHFRVFNSSFGLPDAQFHVLANGLLLLHDFSLGRSGNSETVKDFMIWVAAEKLGIVFVPSKRSKFAFVNAIEVISAPKDLIADVAQYVSSERNDRVNGLLKNGLETLYRVNVGGPKVTPFNDSLWRTWTPDDEYLQSRNGSERVYFGGRIKYQLGGASREVGPDNVYNTARILRSLKDSIPRSNISWDFPVAEGYQYLVRMHFADIASIALDVLYFNVYVNGNLAYENLDLSSATNGMLASPFYADFVVEVGNTGILTVSAGPSNMSRTDAVDAILNGLEIMKLNNSMGSFDGTFCAHSILRGSRRGSPSIVFPLVAAVFLLLTVSIVLQRRKTGFRDSVVWSRLPVDVSEIGLKYSNQLSPGKV